jgi:hypothetical protein
VLLSDYSPTKLQKIRELGEVLKGGISTNGHDLPLPLRHPDVINDMQTAKAVLRQCITLCALQAGFRSMLPSPWGTC